MILSIFSFFFHSALSDLQRFLELRHTNIFLKEFEYLLVSDEVIENGGIDHGHCRC